MSRKSAGGLYEIKATSDNTQCLMPDASSSVTMEPCSDDSAVWRLKYQRTESAAAPVNGVDCFNKFVGWRTNLLQPLATTSASAHTASDAAKLCSADRACVAFAHVLGMFD